MFGGMLNFTQLQLPDGGNKKGHI